MRLEDIQGKLDIVSVEREEDAFVFSFDGTLPDFESVSVVYWNMRVNAECTEPLDRTLWQQKKIRLSNWKNAVEKVWTNPQKIEIVLLLRGVSQEGKSYYFLGGEGDLSGVFSKEDLLLRLQEETMKECWIRTALEGVAGWVFQIVSPTAFLAYLIEQGMLKKTYLSVDTIRSVDEGLALAASDEGHLPPDACRSYWLYDENHGILYRKELRTEGGVVVVPQEHLRELGDGYLQGQQHIRIFPFFSRKGKWTCFEYRRGGIRKDTRYNRSGRYEQPIPIPDAAEPLVLMPYYTPAGYLHMNVKRQSQIFDEMIQGRMQKIYVRRQTLFIHFTLPKSAYRIKEVSLILRSDVQQKAYPFALQIKEKRDGLKVVGALPLDGIAWEQFYWDIRGTVTRDAVDYELRIRNYSRLGKLFMILKYQQVALADGEHIIYPYMTKSRDFAVEYRLRTPQDNRKFMCKEYLALFLYYLLRPYWIRREIWLVYEKYSITAQDNSLYFFEYCMNRLPENEKRHIYYVIDKNASDYQYLLPYKERVIQFLSLKHMIYMKAAKLLISSDTKAHAYAWHSPQSVYRTLLKNNRNVFLQHGVIYYKQCHRGLRKNGTNSCRLFIVSSEVEKKIVMDYFGYNDNEVAVTGLARWDVLEDTSVKGEKMILVMPTWRSWLEEVTQEAFAESDYYRNYMALLNSTKLHAFLEEEQVELVFYIHPKFREYISAFATDCPRIRMIEFGTQPLNELLMKCNMMVTDYSSACWDVFYQGKPVLFYLFDFELYNQVQGSYVDMRTEAFGDTTTDMDELVALMRSYTQNGFAEKPEYAAMRETLLPYRDHNNCERTYLAIRKKFYSEAYEEMEEVAREDSQEEE